MNFYSVISGILAFLQNNIIVAVVLGLVLLYILYRSPKVFFIVLFIAILLSGLFYIMTDVSSIGTHHKKKMIREHDLP
jgi:hypothetical protein